MTARTYVWGGGGENGHHGHNLANAMTPAPHRNANQRKVTQIIGPKNLLVVAKRQVVFMVVFCGAAYARGERPPLAVAVERTSWPGIAARYCAEKRGGGSSPPMG